MATPNLFGSNQSITLERNKVITITKRTVRFSKNVYQTHNITGFSEGEVEIGNISWLIILVLFIWGFFTGISNSSIGWLITLAAIGCIVWNFVKPKHYGLLLTLNSGDKKLFITSDVEGLKQVIEVIYSFIESEKEATYQMTINNSKVSGSFIQGSVGGNASYHSND